MRKTSTAAALYDERERERVDLGRVCGVAQKGPPGFGHFQRGRARVPDRCQRPQSFAR